MKKELPRVSAILFLLYGLLTLTRTLSQSFDEDASVMLTLKEYLNPPGWSDPDPCNWGNVACSNQKRVTGIQMGSLNLQGTLPLTLKKLTQLQHLELQHNNISGPLPDFSGLNSLQVLSLSHNMFTGPVPISLTRLASLKVVNLTGNYFQGPMPVFDNGVEVDNDLHRNSFCLPKPGNCDPRVEVLLSIVGLMGYPQILAESWKGNDPCIDWFGIVCFNGNIVTVNFDNLRLSGFISLEYANIKTLHTIALARNNLTGFIPDQLTTLPELALLDVSNNSLYGTVPKFRSNVTVDTSGNIDIKH